MKADLPERNLESISSFKLNDCWKKIGVWGSRECGELKFGARGRDPPGSNNDLPNDPSHPERDEQERDDAFSVCSLPDSRR